MARKSRGFFFVLISFILLLYIFLYLAAWISAIEISEKASSERFRTASVSGIMSQLTKERLDNFFDIAGYYALFKINNHSSDPAHPLQYDPADELRYLRGAFFGCVFNGTSDDFESVSLDYSDDEKGTYTFYAWMDSLNRTLSQAGLEVVSFSVSNENFTQLDHVTFNASMDVSIYVRDRLSTVSVNRSFSLSRQFNVTGFPDPMITREYRLIEPSSTVERQIFFRNISLSNLTPINVINGTQGQGFFYGPMIAAADVTSTNPIPSQRWQYILVGSFEDIVDVANYGQFGAYIVTSAVEYNSYDGCSPSEEGTFNAIQNRTSSCNVTIAYPTDRPFAVIEGLDINSFRGPGGEHHALFIAERSVEQVANNPADKLGEVVAYDIEDLRDAMICTYFFPSGRGPSYAQRLSSDAISLSSASFGMETFLLGMWAGGSQLPDYENYSRVDWEFFNMLEGVKLRGMAGCKSPSMCAAAVGSDAQVGQFRLTDESIREYGAGGIACNDGRAGCD